MLNMLLRGNTRPSISRRRPLLKVEISLATALQLCRKLTQSPDTEAATLPLAAITAAIGLHVDLRLPEPWLPAASPIPLVVYGGSSAVGAFALKFAARANIHPLIVVAGNGASYVETLIDRSKGDTIVDYRKGDDAVVSGIKDALKGAKLSYAFDAVSEKGSCQNIIQVLDPHGHIALVLPYKEIPKTVAQSFPVAGSAHGDNKDIGYGDNKDFAYIYFRYMARGLHEGWLKGHPPEVVPGGLGGIQQALKNLKDGKASAVKYVFRIADTEGVEDAPL